MSPDAWDSSELLRAGRRWANCISAHDRTVRNAADGRPGSRSRIPHSATALGNFTSSTPSGPSRNVTVHNVLIPVVSVFNEERTVARLVAAYPATTDESPMRP